ncbi:DUF3592 domain-containing protein [Streptomyces sp. NPDC013457]|uniref:DUF3592 domain-containing protein n=1 Tax=Streptomyces sp. NPDC013457 TaxID=3364866 RepID=UPI0036FC8018
MGSIQRLEGRRVSVTLGTGALTLAGADGGSGVRTGSRISTRSGSRTDGITVIPLAAVAEARVAEAPGSALEIVLTDGEVHRVEGVPEAASASFAAALADALPERRDPAGSALVIRPAVRRGRWYRIAVVAAIALAYAGYAAWADDTPGERDTGVITGLFPLFVGLSVCLLAVEEVLRRTRLARHGVTTDAERVGADDARPRYYFNDAAGIPRPYTGSGSGSGSGTAPTLTVVYDPRRPDRAAHEAPLAAVIRKVTLLLAGGGLLLWLGAWLAFGPGRP